MMTRDGWKLLAVSAALLGGCDDPPAPDAPEALGVLDAGASVDAGTERPDGSLAEPARVGPAYAALSSDWTATSISILDAEGKVIADDYVHSGSTRAGLVAALSGDVELPKHSGEPGILVLLDRFKTDVVTRIRLSDGVVLGQVKTHTPPDGTTQSSFSSNPQDYVRTDEQSAWITRSEPNLDPGAPELDRGNDLLRIDPRTMERTGDRIDLSSLDSKTTAAGSSAEVRLVARPTRIVRVGGTLVVGISRTAFDFSVVGPGAVALVDLATKRVTPLELPGLKGCTEVDTVPNDVDTVLVSCSGDRAGNPRESAGFVLLGIEAGGAKVETVWRAASDPSPQPFTFPAVSLGGTSVLATANDYSGTQPDVLAVIDLATGAKTEIASVAPGVGRFGIPAFDAATGTLLVPDASLDEKKRPIAGVRRFRREASGAFTALETTRVATSTGMPVHYVYPL